MISSSKGLIRAVPEIYGFTAQIETSCVNCGETLCCISHKCTQGGAVLPVKELRDLLFVVFSIAS